MRRSFGIVTVATVSLLGALTTTYTLGRVQHSVRIADSEADAYALNDKGLNAYRQGDYDSAIRYYEEALAQSPGNEVIEQNLQKARAAKNVPRQPSYARPPSLKFGSAPPGNLGFGSPTSVSSAQQHGSRPPADLGFGSTAAIPLGERVRAGAVAALQGEAHVLYPNGQQRMLVSGGPILAGERIITGPGSRLQISLADDTIFTLGPDTDLVMDDFVYDPSANSGKITARLATGLFRIVTGWIARRDPDNMNVALPSGIIGDRGTDYEIFLAPDGSGTIKVYKGEVIFMPKNGGAPASVFAGQMLTFDPSGRASGPTVIH